MLAVTYTLAQYPHIPRRPKIRSFEILACKSTVPTHSLFFFLRKLARWRKRDIFRYGGFLLCMYVRPSSSETFHLRTLHARYGSIITSINPYEVYISDPSFHDTVVSICIKRARGRNEINGNGRSYGLDSLEHHDPHKQPDRPPGTATSPWQVFESDNS